MAFIIVCCGAFRSDVYTQIFPDAKCAFAKTRRLSHYSIGIATTMAFISYHVGLPVHRFPRYPFRPFISLLANKNACVMLTSSMRLCISIHLCYVLYVYTYISAIHMNYLHLFRMAYMWYTIFRHSFAVESERVESVESLHSFISTMRCTNAWEAVGIWPNSSADDVA